MSWNNVKLSEVVPTFEHLPKGDYVLEILGAQYTHRKQDTGEFQDLSISTSVVSPAEFAGRRVFVDYPDPERPKCEWSPVALKRLEQAVGLEQTEGQDLVELFNSAKGFHFEAPIIVDVYTNANDEEVKRNKVMQFKVRPAA